MPIFPSLHRLEQKAVRPVLILMDLFMSGKVGRETLDKIKSDDRSRAAPVFLTTQDTDDDIVKTYTISEGCHHRTRGSRRVQPGGEGHRKLPVHNRKTPTW